MRRLLLCLSLLTLFYGVQAQQTPSLFKEASVIPPSPEAMAMNQFIDMPVGHYTGIPNISVPIYTLQLPQMSLPISLSYHAGGLKVGEHSSWVGAGWSLNAGGSINRTVRGLPDEFTGTIIDPSPNVCDAMGYGFLRLDEFFFEPGLAGVSRTFLENYHYKTGKISSMNLFPEKNPCAVDSVDFFNDGIYDSEPDLYHFSFPGGSGKFLYNRAKEMVKISADDVDFISSPVDLIPANDWQVVQLENSSFTLDDAAGVRYLFEAVETTNTNSLCVSEILSGNVNAQLRHPSNWKLTRMSRLGNWIEFDYEQDSITYSDHYVNKTFVVAGYNNPAVRENSCTSNRKVYVQRLTGIRTSNGYEVDFVAAADRQDLDDKRLTDVKVFKNGLLKVHFRLDNDQYFGLNEKLKLNGVEQVSTLNTNVTLPGYEFEYFNAPQGGFPDRESTKQDYWGFYNGAYNPNEMIPYTYLTNIINSQSEYHVNKATHVSRHPDLEYTKTGTISKVTYPTGGHTSFNYELNRFYHPQYRKIHFVQMSLPAAGTTEYSESFTVSQTGQVEVLSHIASTEVYPWKLERFATGVWTAVSTPVGQNFQLLDGQYRFAVTAPGGDAGDPTFENGTGGESVSDGSNLATFRLVSKFFQEVLDEPSGGLRVQSMKFFDPLDSATLDKYFVYEETAGKSSGRQFTSAWVPSLPTYYLPGFMSGGTCINNQFQWSQSVSLSNSSTVPVSTYQGSHIGYGNVYEFSYTENCGPNHIPLAYFSPCNVSGVSQHQFHNDWIQHSSPLLVEKDYSYKNGSKSADVQYKYEGSSFNWRENLVKLSETTYNYEEIDEGFEVKGVILKETSDSFCYQWEVGDPLRSDVLILGYTIPAKWYRATGQTTINYDENGENPLTTTSTVYYDPAVTHHFPTSSEVIESTGAKLITEQERDPVNPALMVKQEVFRQEDTTAPLQQISGELVSYYGVLPLSYSVWNREYAGQGPLNTNGYELVKSYSYGGGSMLKSSEDRPWSPSGSRVVYLWSYDSSYVVAQITNITDQELLALIPAPYSSFDDFAGETVHSSIQNTLATIRANLTDPSHLMTTYLYESPFGLSKTIDPNGRETSYVYDEFGRLVQVMDHDGNVLSETEYNYSNQ